MLNLSFFVKVWFMLDIQLYLNCDLVFSDLVLFFKLEFYIREDIRDVNNLVRYVF